MNPKNLSTLASVCGSLMMLSLAAMTMGCGTLATISTAHAHPVDAEIVSSDSEFIYVRYGNRGGRDTIPRASVSDIDHPGNVAATIGTLVTAYGVANIAIGAPECDRGGAAYCTGVFLPAAIGLPIMVWGFYTYFSSVNAAAPGVQVAVLPTASFQKKNESYGANVVVSF